MPRQQELVIRQATESDARAMARLHAAVWKATYRGIMPDTVLDGMSEEAGTPRFVQRIRDATERYPILIALMSDRIVGFCSTAQLNDPIDDFDCEIRAIYVNPSDQNKGVGHALMKVAAQHLLQSQHKELIIWAAAENPWRRFYEKLGGELLQSTKTVEIGGRPIAHVAYGWRDLNALLR